MTDIVQRLRDTIINETPARYPDVIEAAIAEIEKLRTALQDCRMFFDATGRDLHVMKIDAALGRHEQ